MRYSNTSKEFFLQKTSTARNFQENIFQHTNSLPHKKNFSSLIPSLKSSDSKYISSRWSSNKCIRDFKKTPTIEGILIKDISSLYRAKCKDLGILYSKDKEARFIKVCSSLFKHKAIDLKNNGLGLESSKALCLIILKNINFSQLNISQNQISDKGVKKIGKALAKNKNFIHVNISSNTLSPEGLYQFIKLITPSQSLISLNLSSVDRINKNRLGTKGAEALYLLMSNSKILNFLNISGTSLGNEGTELVIKGIYNNKSLLFVSLGFNVFDHRVLDSLCNSVAVSNIIQLVISGNSIGNKGCDYFYGLFIGNYQPCFELKKFEVSQCEISEDGANKLFFSLENNMNAVELDFSDNFFGPNSGVCIGKCLNLNGTIENLNLTGCDLRDEGIFQLSEGLYNNFSLKKLVLAKNFITDTGVQHIAKAISLNFHILFIDLSINSIKNIGGEHLANSLKKNKTIQTILLNENSLRDEFGALMAEITRFMNNILRLELESNFINNKYLETIQKNLKHNNFLYRNQISPKIKKELEILNFREDRVQETFEKISQMEKEKTKFSKKIEKQQNKLNLVKTEEFEKFQKLMLEKAILLNKKHQLNKEIEANALELYRLKTQKEREIREIRESLAKTENQIKILEKNSIF